MIKKAMLCAAFAAGSAAAWCGVDENALARARDILARMTLEEKVLLCAGNGSMTMSAIPRVGIDRELQYADTSHTVRGNMERWDWGCTDTGDESTVLPTLSALAATWDVDLATRFGHVMGEQARARGKDVMLGPGVNLMRTPLCGRNWEYMSEDPCLSADLVVPEIKALQSHDVAACIKPYCLNSQEDDRFNVDTVCDDRTLNEVYLHAFRAAVKDAGVWTLMTSYNLYDGIRVSEHPYLLKGVLRERWGFDGLIVTDWGGQRSTVPAALSGAGVEMNRGMDIRYFYNPKEGTYPLAEAVRKGLVPESCVDEKALRTLYTMARMRFFEPEKRKTGERLTARHQAEALAIAEQAIVLLKNDASLLPLDPEKMKKIVLVGNLADTEHCRKGWSAEGKPLYEVTPRRGIEEYFKRRGRAVEVIQAPLVANDEASRLHPVVEASVGTFDTTAKDSGMSVRAWQVSYWDNVRFEGEPVARTFSRACEASWGDAAPVPGKTQPRAFSCVFATDLIVPESGDYALGLTMDERALAEIRVDGETLVRDQETGALTVQCRFEKGKTYRLEIRYAADSRAACRFSFGWLLPSERGMTLEQLRRLSETADAVFVFTGTEGGHGRALECEGADRPNLKLPIGHDEAIAEILSWKLPNVAVVNHSGAPMEFPWLDACATLVQQPYLGQEAGRALARVLFGDVNPSGRLPCTWPKRYEDTAVARKGTYTKLHSIYNEGFYFGYRWHDKSGIEPMFPFGFGLGYTTFSFGAARVERTDAGWTVLVDVTNTGRRAGRETVQVYLAYPEAKVERCVKDLRGFAKVALEPGETKTVSVALEPRDLAYWDVVTSRFVADAGRYDVLVGASAADIRARTSLTLEKRQTFAD
jgi:beta-glucosidase